MTDDRPPADGDEACERIETPYFTGVRYRDRVELTIQCRQLTDDDNLNDFGESLMNVCTHEKACRVLIDVAQLEFVTSSLLARFIQLQRTTRREGGRVVLASPGENFRDVLEVTNLDDFFEVTKTVDEARQALARESSPERES